MPQFADLVADRFEEWGHVPHIVRAVFPDGSAAGVASALDDFCRRQFGAGVQAPEFFEASVGSVHGLRLEDGRRVVVKVHGPRTSVGFLAAVQAVQRHLADRGFPAPVPLVGPVAFGRGRAVAETLLDTGEHADARQPPVRGAMATSLARLVRLCRGLTGLAGLRDSIMEVRGGQLWPVPHDGRFDFEATSAGAEWIDRLAAKARLVRDRHGGEEVVGHRDWREQHLRFAGGRLTAVYDWDSLCIAREPALVGSVAHAFTANWEVAGRLQFPSLPEALAFVSEYEDARGGQFSVEEREALLGSFVYTMAYTARCEHSDELTDMGRRPPRRRAVAGVPRGTARSFLAMHACELLGVPDDEGIPEVLSSDVRSAPG